MIGTFLSVVNHNMYSHMWWPFVEVVWLFLHSCTHFECFWKDKIWDLRAFGKTSHPGSSKIHISLSQKNPRPQNKVWDGSIVLSLSLSPISLLCTNCHFSSKEHRTSLFFLILSIRSLYQQRFRWSIPFYSVSLSAHFKYFLCLM